MRILMNWGLPRMFEASDGMYEVGVAYVLSVGTYGAKSCCKELNVWDKVRWKPL